MLRVVEFNRGKPGKTIWTPKKSQEEQKQSEIDETMTTSHVPKRESSALSTDPFVQPSGIFEEQEREKKKNRQKKKQPQTSDESGKKSKKTVNVQKIINSDRPVLF